MATRANVGRANSVESKQPRRQANACLRCYEKKVKCDMGSFGKRCTGCERDGVTCQKRTRKPYPPRKEFNSISRSRSDRSSPSRNSVTSNPVVTPPRSAPVDPLHTPPFPPEPFEIPNAYMGPTNDDFSIPVHDISGMMPHATTELDATMPFLSGDEQGYAYLLDMCNADRLPAPQDCIFPQSPTDILSPDELAYAKARGCYSMPSHAICEDLVQCYFHYVHPLLPIMNIADFLEQYTGGAFEGTSLLLLWSMFSVAANFASDSTVVLSGCATRQELKKLMYGRAKCLYELGYERDKITLIQSALLLGFWYSDLQDHAQSWHWTGIAISTAQTIGLHRDPDSRHFNPAISTPRRRLWANIWWCCFFRDRWLAFGYGRPLRIHADDCDVPMVKSDCMLELPDRAPKEWRKYVPPELPHLVPIWTGLLQLTVVLGDILVANYQPGKAPLDGPSIAALERRVTEALPDKQARPLYPELLLFFESLGRLHVEATMIALYRPYASEFLASRACNSDAEVDRLANARIKAAATRASGILDRVVSTDTLRFAGPMIVPLLVPSMTVHLLQARSQDQFTSSWSRNRLELSLMVLKRLEDNYPAAALVHQLFAQAKEKDTSPAIEMARTDSTSSLDDSQANSVHHWSVPPLDLQSPSTTGHSGPTAPWDNPEEVVSGFDLWSLSPTEGNKLYFLHDDMNVNRI